MHNFARMKIEQYISQLLYRHQCVTVPGFGAFLTEIQSAQLHESTNSFYPPKKVVSFNAQLKTNDGLLANHIAGAEKTPYEDAVLSIQSEVEIWKSILDVNGKFPLKNIGELSLNAERNVVFYPSDNFNYLKESFGLNSFVSPSIKREEYKEIVEKLEEKAPIIFTPEAQRRSNPFLKYAAVAAVVIALAGTLGYQQYNNYVATETLAVKNAVQEKVQQQIQEATFLMDSPIAAITLTVKEEKLPYHIMAGAFRNENNARQVYTELIASGYKARRLAPNRWHLYPVLFGSYSTLAEAQKAMVAIRADGNPDAWIMVKNL